MEVGDDGESDMPLPDMTTPQRRKWAPTSLNGPVETPHCQS